MSVKIEGEVRVLFHLNGGFTKVEWIQFVGNGHAGEGVHWDIPTEIIPEHLRGISSRFILKSYGSLLEIEEIRES